MPAPSPTPSRGMVRVEVAGVGQGGLGDVIVVLRELGGAGRLVPIHIGLAEGVSIAVRLEGGTPPRPLTHDLLDSVLRSQKLTIVRIEVDGLRDGTFLGRLFLAEPGGRVVSLDARPSDCIALAIGAGAPMFVAADVVNETSRPPGSFEFEIGE
jgi:bifunctional DNase/RNase